MRIGRPRPEVGLGSPLRRLVALALASLLLAGTLDAGLVHPCPHHDPLPGSGVHRGVHHGAPDDARDGQPHAAGHAAEAHAGACTCIGDCLAGGGLSVAPATVVRPGEAPVVETTARRLDSGRAAPVRRVAYLLPYSTAPPPRH
jgi:hypothetical protein